MRVFLKIMLIFGFAFTSLMAVSLSEAETLFKNQDYGKAKDAYSRLLKEHPTSTTILYNLGNTYLKNGELGQAILHYERALQYTPRDPDLLFNLKLAKSQVVDQTKTSAKNALRDMLYAISVNESFILFWLAIGFFTLFFGLYTKKKQSELIKNMMGVGIVFILLFGAGLSFKVNQVIGTNWGIVMDKKVTVYSGPAETFEVLFNIHEGTKVQEIKQTLNWSEIILDNGFRGWVKKQSIEQV